MSLRRCALALILAAGCGGLALRPASATLGDTLSDVLNTDFFSFFHLQEFGRGIDAGMDTIVSYKPQSAQFAPLVTVNLVLEEGRIAAQELVLARSFVDDAQNGVFARDIAKSLLRSVVPPADQALVEDLANEIEFQGQGLVLSAQPKPALPAVPTLAYQVYLGQDQSYETTIGNTKLRLTNLSIWGTDSLVISLSAI